MFSTRFLQQLRKEEERVLCDVKIAVHLPCFVLSYLKVAIAPNGPLQLSSPGAEGVQGLQTFTNAGGTPLLQYVQTSDGQQILVPSNQVVVQSKYPLQGIQNR